MGPKLWKTILRNNLLMVKYGRGSNEEVAQATRELEAVQPGASALLFSKYLGMDMGTANQTVKNYVTPKTYTPKVNSQTSSSQYNQTRKYNDEDEDENAVNDSYTPPSMSYLRGFIQNGKKISEYSLHRNYQNDDNEFHKIYTLAENINKELIQTAELQDIYHHKKEKVRELAKIDNYSRYDSKKAYLYDNLLKLEQRKDTKDFGNLKEQVYSKEYKKHNSYLPFLQVTYEYRHFNKENKTDHIYKDSGVFKDYTDSNFQADKYEKHLEKVLKTVREIEPKRRLALNDRINFLNGLLAYDVNFDKKEEERKRDEKEERRYKEDVYRQREKDRKERDRQENTRIQNMQNFQNEFSRNQANFQNEFSRNQANFQNEFINKFDNLSNKLANQQRSFAESMQAQQDMYFDDTTGNLRQTMQRFKLNKKRKSSAPIGHATGDFLYSIFQRKDGD